MLTVLSPAKSLDYESEVTTAKNSIPIFLSEAEQLVKRMRKYSPGEISDLMGISTKLGQLNADRFAEWNTTCQYARQSALAFNGDVYSGFDATSLTERDLTSAQRRIRILSGLYGVLKPLDMIHPYRLEMGTKFETGPKRSLYEFWGSKISGSLNQELSTHRSKVLVNLASAEYFGAVDLNSIDARVVTPTFKEYRNGTYKFMSFVGKRARGTMARYIAQNKVETVAGLKKFDVDGYYYSHEQSTVDGLVFLRD